MPDKDCPRRCCAKDGQPRRGRGSLLEPAVLAALAQERAHGYDVRKTIEELTGGHVPVDPGGVYRCLRRMEDEGLIASVWVEGDVGPQKREYRLTPDGRVQLAGWVGELREREAMLQVLGDAVAAAAQSGSAD